MDTDTKNTNNMRVVHSNDLEKLSEELTALGAEWMKVGEWVEDLEGFYQVVRKNKETRETRETKKPNGLIVNERVLNQLLSEVSFLRETLAENQSPPGSNSSWSIQRLVSTTQARLLEASRLYDETGSWMSLSPYIQNTIFSEDAELRADAVKASRYYSLFDPLLSRAVWLVIRYVWGRGISEPKAADPLVQKVIDQYWKDPRNNLITKPNGQWELSQALIEDGELFLVNMVDTLRDGSVRTSYVLPDQITQVITDESDWRTPLYYERTWYQQVFDWNSKTYSGFKARQDYYPDWNCKSIQPSTTPKPLRETIQGVFREASRSWTICVFCGAPRISSEDHCLYCDENVTEALFEKLNGDDGTLHDTVSTFHTKVFMGFYKTNSRGIRGMPAFYSAIRYVKAYKGWLQDRITLLIALATFAFEQNIKGNSAAAQRMVDDWGDLVLGRYGDGSNSIDTERAPGSRVYIGNDAATLKPMSVDTGASNAISDARLLRSQIAAATHLTTADLTGDGTEGSYATLREMAGAQMKNFEWWQELFKMIIQDQLNFVVRSSIIYGELPLKTQDGKMRDLSVEIDFPPIINNELPSVVSALAQLIQAQGLSGVEYLTPDRIARLVLKAFGEDDIDMALAELDLDQKPSQQKLPAQINPEELPDEAASKLAEIFQQLKERDPNAPIG